MDELPAPDSDGERSPRSDEEVVDGVGFNFGQLSTCVDVLEALGRQPDLLDSVRAFKPLRRSLQPFLETVKGRYFRGRTVEEDDDRRFRQQQKCAQKQRAKQQDKIHADKTKLRAARLAALKDLQETNATGVRLIPDGAVDAELPTAPLVEDGTAVAADEGIELSSPRSCYQCKKKFTVLHFFYAELCEECAELNYAKRVQMADLNKRVALVTGARVKIGYQIALRLLRCGAMVVATSRFPSDTAKRFAAEADFSDWAPRLHVYGVDFRDIVAVERLELLALPEAARHVLKGNEALSHAVAEASLSIANTESATGPHDVRPGHGLGGNSGLLSQVPLVLGDEEHDESLFPLATHDVNAQQVDLRDKHSWTFRLHEIPTPEAMEVMAINAITPLVLNGKLKPLMERSPASAKFIINVSAMEGKFYRWKSPTHPHTNMAKAALNMMTRTSAEDYSKSGIYMNAVDTGWINDENPLQKIDAASRVLDPVLVGVRENVLYFGKFFKDYAETEW